MSDLLQMTGQGFTVKDSGSGFFLQDLSQVVDVSAYDQVDIRFTLHSVDTGKIDFYLLTSMQNKSEGDWEALDSAVQLPVSGSPPAYRTKTFPSPILSSTSTPPVPLLRYLRWKVVFAAGATIATIQIEGLLRRKAS